MRELSLFTGAGGGLLGTQLLGWEPVGYVEWNKYCQKLIAARIRDGILPNAPIFGDVRAFVSDGYARAYQGMVDVITGGFPCQPFSAAGKLLGKDDPRNMWPSVVECLSVVRPRYALLENVASIITSGYFETILGDLTACGYDARWRVISAAEVGAPHKRDRVWIVADSTSGRREQCNKEKWKNSKPNQLVVSKISVENAAQFSRADHDLAHRVDRLGAIGNGQVPAVVRAAWSLMNWQPD